MSESKLIVEMQHISKHFPGVQALNKVSLELRPGEIHALVGENGAGKSTLMKVLCGVYQPDSGVVRLNGETVHVKNPRHAQELGLSVVHQELNLFQNLTIAENIFGGKMPQFGPFGFEDRRQAYNTAQEFLQKFDLPLDPNTLVNRLSIAQQQVVEISKALIQKAQVLILDEPTSSLTEHEANLLFEIIQNLRTEGMCIVYISHRLEEVFKIADRVTVLRDGQYVGTKNIKDIDIAAVIRMMIGRKLEDLYGQSAATIGQEVLRVDHLTYRGRFEDISFSLHAGEIVGMAGLIGAGRTDVGLSLFGFLPPHSGAIKIDGQVCHLKSPQQAMSLGIAYLSENRKQDALFNGMTVRSNITVCNLPKFSEFGFLSYKKEKAEAEKYIKRLNIQTPGPEQRIINLSGGNQQKAMLARWLTINPKILIVDEPTRGVDVGAKLEIYSLLHHLAAEGVAILFISSEMPELLGMCDRILVMYEGKLTGELTRAEATEEKIMTLAARLSAKFA